jgi:hypothetical protein
MHRKEQDSSRSWFPNGLAEVSCEEDSRLEFQLARLVAGGIPKLLAQCKDFTGELASFASIFEGLRLNYRG